MILLRDKLEKTKYTHIVQHAFSTCYPDIAKCYQCLSPQKYRKEYKSSIFTYGYNNGGYVFKLINGTRCEILCKCENLGLDPKNTVRYLVKLETAFEDVLGKQIKYIVINKNGLQKI